MATRTKAAGTRKNKLDSVPRQKGRPRSTAAKIGSEKVVDTARQLLRQPRPLQISRSEVAKAAGVDEKLVRYYFENYEDLLDQVTDGSIAELEKVMTEASKPQKKPSHVVRERARALIGFLAENPAFFKLLVDRVYGATGKAAQARLEDLNARAYERHLGAIQAGRKAGEFRDDFDPRLLYIAIIGMSEFFTTGRPVVEFIFGESADKVRGRYEKFVFDLLMRGIGKK
jgi:TetR/AcrR family transcriptional regulator